MAPDVIDLKAITSQLRQGLDLTDAVRIDGRTRRARRLKADAARRDEIAAGLLADLQRPPNMTDRVWAGNVAAQVWRAEQLEAIGKDATELRRLINQWHGVAVSWWTPLAPNRQAIVPCQAIINLAADSELCPHIRVKRYKTETKIKQPFTLEWVQQFRRHASPQLGALALFMLVTGTRVSESLRIFPDDVDFNTKTAIIRRTKIKEGRIVHLPAELIAALANIPRIPGRPLFLYRSRNDCYRVWDTAVKRAGLKRLTLHSGRHGFATTILRAGVDPKTGAWLGGWKSIRHFMESYAHAIEDITLNERILDTPVTQAETKIKVKPAKRA